MKCQHCQSRPASINVTLRMNGHSEQLQICQHCFNEIRKQSPHPMGFFDNNQSNFSEGPSGFHGQVTDEKAFEQADNKGLLDELGTNLTDAAKQGLIDPVIGRQEEVNRVIETLNRRTKNNPVLIGEPGVGKTAIAEGLALKISEGSVPKKIKNKSVYLLDVASLVTNTGIRGQFEERMKGLIKELQSRKNVILFIDEIHLIVGAGTAEGSQMDAGNLLKPALARGELQLIGATTLKEYRQIEKDQALARRFQPIMVKEPSEDETVEILKGLRDRYEAYHHVTYTDEVLSQAVYLSKRYIQDRFLPDKAIDLMDEAGAKLNLTLSETDKSEIEEALQQIAKEKEEAAEKEDYELAANLRHKELQLEKKLAETTSIPSIEVTVEAIQKIIEDKTGVPVRKMQRAEQSKMRELSAELNKKVIGQVEAVSKVAKAIRRSRAGLKAKNRPIGSFLFVGPTGVGKTELTKVLAENLFGSKDALVRLDMSEYMEKHAVSKIIGSPPGYVGHEEAGQLTEKVRRNPYSLILLDEIEKAHPDVQHMFLQIMEDGRLTDSQGRTVNFKDTVIIMTSNAGSGITRNSLGFNKDKHDAVSVLEGLKDYFKPEFLNRFDAIIPFNTLSKTDLIKIVELMLSELELTLKEQGHTIEVSERVKHHLAEVGYDETYGARPLRRVIQELIEDELTDIILDNDVDTHFIVDLSDDKISIKTA